MSSILHHLFLKPKMPTRLVMVMVGQLIMGFAVAVLRLAYLGTDPYSSMMLALSNLTPLSYGSFCALGNIFFFLIEILWGRKYVGLGTVANWFLLGYFVDFSVWLLNFFGAATPDPMAMRLLVCVAGVVILAFSLSVYQSADIGSSPYDSLALIVRDRTPLPFFLCRILVDGSAALIAFLTGGVLGIASILVFLGVGPVAGFFNTHFSEKLVKK